MRLKIAFIVHSFPTLSETFILNQITGLIDLGHEIDIYSRGTPPRIRLHEDIEKYRLDERTYYLDYVPANKIIRVTKALEFMLKNVHIKPLSILKSLNIFKYKKGALSLYYFYYAMPFIRKKYDIIQCHFGPNGNFGALLKELGIEGKLVTMFHGYDIRLGIEKGGDIYRRLFELGDCFLANSDYSYKNLLYFGADTQKTIIHPVGINLDIFNCRDESADKDHSNPLNILTVARLVEEKGLKYGIRTIRKILDIKPDLLLKYYIAGEGPLENVLKNLVVELKLNDTVCFLGGMTQSEIAQVLKKAHIFLLPSIEESFGLVLLEAQAVGLPVVATNIGGVNQAMYEGRSEFLVPAKDINAMAERLTFLIEHSELWPEMGRAGRQFVEKYYDIKMLNKKLVQIYERLISQT